MRLHFTIISLFLLSLISVEALKPRSPSQSRIHPLHLDIEHHPSPYDENHFEMSPVHILNAIFYQRNGTMVFWGPSDILQLKNEHLQRNFSQDLQNLLVEVIGGDRHRFFTLSKVLLQYVSMIMFKTEQICSPGNCTFIRDLQESYYPDHFLKYPEYYRQYVQHKTPLPGNYWTVGYYELYWDSDSYFSDQEDIFAEFQSFYNDALFFAMSPTLLASCLNFDFMDYLQLLSIQGVGFEDGNFVWTEYATDQLLDDFSRSGFFRSVNPSPRMNGVDQKFSFILGVLFNEIYRDCRPGHVEKFLENTGKPELKLNRVYEQYQLIIGNTLYTDLWTADQEEQDKTGKGLYNFTELLYSTFENSFEWLSSQNSFSNQELVLMPASLHYDNQYIQYQAMEYKRDYASLPDQIITLLGQFNPTDMNETEIEEVNEGFENDLYELYDLDEFMEKYFNLTPGIMQFQHQYMSLFQNISDNVLDLEAFVIQAFKLFAQVDLEYSYYLSGVCGYPESYKLQNDYYSDNADLYYHCKLQYKEVLKLKGLRIAGYQLMMALSNPDLFTYLVQQNNQRFNCHEKYISQIGRLNIYENYEESLEYIVEGVSCLMYIGQYYRQFSPHSALPEHSPLRHKYEAYFNYSNFEFQDSLLALNGKYQLQNSVIYAMLYSQGMIGNHDVFSPWTIDQRDVYFAFLNLTFPSLETIVSTQAMMDLVGGLMNSLLKRNIRDFLEYCLPVSSYSQILKELTSLSYAITSAQDFFEVLSEWMPFLMNVDYILQNCQGSLEDEEVLLRFYHDLSDFSQFLNTHYQMHSNSMTLIGELLVEYDQEQVARHSESLANLVTDEQIKYFDFGQEMGKLLLSALGKEDKGEMIGKWLEDPSIAPILNSVALLSDKLVDLQIGYFYVPNKDSHQFDEYFGFKVANDLFDDILCVYDHLGKSLGGLSFSQFQNATTYTVGGSIVIGDAEFTSNQSLSQVETQKELQEQLRKDLMPNQREFQKEALIEFEDYNNLESLFSQLEKENKFYSILAFFADILMDFPVMAQMDSEPLGFKMDLLYTQVGVAIIPAIGRPSRFVRNLFCKDWC